MKWKFKGSCLVLPRIKVLIVSDKKIMFLIDYATTLELADLNISVRENYDGFVKGYKSMIPFVKLIWQWIHAAYDSIRWWNKNDYY